MDKKYTLNTLLAVVLGVLLLAAVAVRAFLPHIILPKPDIPTLTAISLVVLVLDHYLAPGAQRCYICIPLLSAVTFGLLPWASMFVGALDALKLAVFGGSIFTAATWAFSSIQDRLSSGPKAPMAPVMSALGIWLAVQAFAGILL